MATTYTNSSAYYNSSGTPYGDYRYLSLETVIDSFVATYVGENKICKGVYRGDITYHATRALQELSYDTLRCTKDFEIEVPATLIFVLPHDYINYVKLTTTDDGGIEKILYPTSRTSNPRRVTNTIDSHGGFSTGIQFNNNSQTWDKFKNREIIPSQNINSGADDAVFDYLVGNRYGLEPQYAQQNGSYYIDEELGRIHFGSSLNGKIVTLKYISDGLITQSTTDGTININACLVPKLAEEAIIKHILYGVLLAKADTPAGLLAQIKKERFSETRKAKIRLSNLKSEEITQILRGSTKHIKH